MNDDTHSLRSGSLTATGGTERSFSLLRVRGAWLLASLVPSFFLVYLIAIARYGAPEHDDFCFADLNVRDGFAQTVVSFYNGLSGRIIPLWLIQISAAGASAAGTSILHANFFALAAFAVLFVAGSAFAMIRMWPARSSLLRAPALATFGARSLDSVAT